MTPRRFSFIDRWLLKELFELTGHAAVRLVLEEGEETLSLTASPRGTIVIRDSATLAKLLLDPELGFAEAYADGRVRVEGDLVSVLEAIYRGIRDAGDRSWLGGLVSHWLQWAQANTLRRSARNIHNHYDLEPDFYRHWLDRDLIYSCAYFEPPNATLEQAQAAKMDYVCRKLQLQPGETVVEAGCGWGALALYMARHYGVSVRAFNISHSQIRYARERARDEGLTGQVEFVEDDYRNLRGRYDAFISVGMLEHVGADHHADLGAAIHRSIGMSGRGLLHFIGRNRPSPLSRWIRKRIFPGAYAPSLREAVAILEPWDYSVLDVENLRLHYAKTVEHWLARFERSYAHAAETFDDHFLRAWRLYLAGSVAAFRVGTMQLFQIVFAGRDCRRLPWSREHLYFLGRRDEPRSLWTHAMS